jgi:hypothetical protein
MSFSTANVAYPFRAMIAGSPVASQSLTVSTAAVAPAGYTVSPDVNGVNYVTFDVQTNSVRVRWDGTDPTGTVGHVLYAGSAYTWAASQFNASKFIRISTATADAVIFSSALQS